MTNIKERIKELRKEKGLTQEELAKMLGLSAKSNIANYENGANAPSDDVKLKMCEIFNCTMDYLMGKSEFKTNKAEFLNYREKLALDAMVDSYSMFLSLGLSPEQISFLKNFSMKNVDDKDMEQLEAFIEQFPKENRKNILSAIKIYLNKQKKQLESDNLKSFQKEMTQYYMCPVYGKISAGQPNWAEECLEGYLPIDLNLMGIINPEECFFLKVDGESMNKVIRNGAYALIRKQDIVNDGEIAAVLVNGFEATLKRFSRQGDFIILEPMSTDKSFKMQIYDKNTNIKILGKYIGKFEINK